VCIFQKLIKVYPSIEEVEQAMSSLTTRSKFAMQHAIYWWNTAVIVLGELELQLSQLKKYLDLCSGEIAELLGMSHCWQSTSSITELRYHTAISVTKETIVSYESLSAGHSGEILKPASAASMLDLSVT